MVVNVPAAGRLPVRPAAKASAHRKQPIAYLHMCRRLPC
jgi:hypothetical protein